MNAERLQAIKENYENMNWDDFRENAGVLLQREIDIYDAVVIEGVPALIAEVERLQALADFEVKCTIKANQENERLRAALNKIAYTNSFSELCNVEAYAALILEDEING